MTTHLDTGSWGEEQAEHFLKSKGYTLLFKNYGYQHAEIDLIVEKGRLLVFVEVKTRRWTAFGLPETFVNASKVRLLKKAAEHFIFEYDWKYDIRFDIISILIQGQNKHSIHHIEDAFY